MSNNLIEVKDVVKSFGDYVALDKINLSIPAGSVYGLLGPNGAGKTTLMRIVNQITAPDYGKILFNNEKLSKKHIKEIGYMPEERGLYKKMKVGEQALYLAQLKGLKYNEALKRLKKWFEKLEIIDWWDKKVEELSKGMAQKIQFIVTVMHSPKLLIFDEPFSGFDPVNASIIKEEILTLSKSGTTIIFSTHRMESVEEICTHIALINKSRTILDGSINQIKKQFSQNTFYLSVNEAKITNNDFFEVIKKTKNGNQIKLKENVSEKQTLDFLNKNYSINSYVKETPSIEDIFIRTINNA